MDRLEDSSVEREKKQLSESPNPGVSISFHEKPPVRQKVVPGVFARKFLYAYPLGFKPQIDGKLEENWKEYCPPLPVPVFPAEEKNIPPTTAFLGYDTENLYLGFDCREPNINDLKERARTKADKVWRDDSIEIFLDFAFDQKTYYHFIMNTPGVMLENLYTGLPERETVSISRGAVWKGTEGWQSEVMIPLKKLREKPFGLCSIALVRNQWAHLKGKEKPVARYYLLPDDNQLFHQPEKWIPLGFWSKDFRLAGLDISPVQLGNNFFRFDLALATKETKLPIKAVSEGGGITITDLSQEIANSKKTVSIQYELWNPGKHGIGAFIGEKNQQYVGIRPEVPEVLQGPVYNKKLYTPEDKLVNLDYEILGDKNFLKSVSISGCLKKEERSIQRIGPVFPEAPAFSIMIDVSTLSPGKYVWETAINHRDSGKQISAGSAEFEVIPGIIDARSEWPVLPEENGWVDIPAQRSPYYGTRTIRVYIYYPDGTIRSVNKSTGLFLTLHNWGGVKSEGTADPEVLAIRYNTVGICVDYLQSGAGSPPESGHPYDCGYLQALDVLRALYYVYDGLRVRRIEFDKSRIYGTGGSGGGNVILMANKLAPRTFACIVDLSGLGSLTDEVAFGLSGSKINAGYSQDPRNPNYLTKDDQELRDPGNVKHLRLMKKLGNICKIVVCHGADDQSCPVTDKKRIVANMKNAGLDVEASFITRADIDGKLIEDSGHSLGNRTQLLIKFADKYFQEDSPEMKELSGKCDFECLDERVEYKTNNGSYVISYGNGYPVGSFVSRKS